MMSELLTESFCERCGTRYTFESGEPESKRAGLKKARVLARGLKNFVMSDDVTLDTAMTEAKRDEERTQTTLQLEAFHETFNFCMDCRQYTCGDCWNEAEGRCLSCAPAPGRIESALYPEYPDEVDGSDRLTALLGGAATAAPPPLQLSAPPASPPFGGWPEGSAPAADPGAPSAAEGLPLAPPPVLRPYSLERQGAGSNGPAAPLAPLESTPAAAEAFPFGLEAPVDAVEPAATLEAPTADAAAWTEPEAAEEVEAVVPLEAAAPEPIAEPIVAAAWASDEGAPPEDAFAAPSQKPVSLEEVLLAASAAAATPPVMPAPPGSAAAEPARVAEPVMETLEAAAIEAEPAEVEPEVAELAHVAELAEPAPAEPMPSIPPPAPVAPPSPPIAQIPVALPVAPPAAPTAPVSPPAAPEALPAAARLPGWDVVAPEAGSRAQGVPTPRPASSRDVQPAPWFTARTNSSVWDVSSAEVVSRAGAGVQACVSCGLPLSASAHFCRRCGSRQAA